LHVSPSVFSLVTTLFLDDNTYFYVDEIGAVCVIAVASSTLSSSPQFQVWTSANVVG